MIHPVRCYQNSHKQLWFGDIVSKFGKNYSDFKSRVEITHMELGCWLGQLKQQNYVRQSIDQ